MKVNSPSRITQVLKVERHRSAFSLIELLAVMALVGMLAVASVPAVSSLTGGQNLAHQASTLQDILEQARTHAMAKNTYVFVGITETDGGQADSVSPTSGVGRLAVVVVGSKDGTRYFGSGNANLTPLMKLRRMDNVHLATDLPNSGRLARPAVAKENQVGDGSFSAENTFSWPLSGGKYTFTKIIQFDPSGVASVQASGNQVPQWMEIALVETRGNVVLESSANAAALILDGVTGSVKVYRP